MMFRVIVAASYFLFKYNKTIYEKFFLKKRKNS